MTQKFRFWRGKTSKNINLIENFRLENTDTPLTVMNSNPRLLHLDVCYLKFH